MLEHHHASQRVTHAITKAFGELKAWELRCDNYNVYWFAHMVCYLENLPLLLFKSPFQVAYASEIKYYAWTNFRN